MGDTVYLDYDQAGLDAQYNLRARWPDHDRFFDRWASESAAVRDRLDCRLDLAYGPTAGQRLDLFPADGSPAPLIAFIHGGYWQALDKSDFSYLASAFRDQELAFASLNYDLAPGAGIAEMVGQIRRALLWTRDHAGELGIDAERICAVGHSAGGHLVAMAMATDRSNPDRHPQPPLAAGCSISGLYDLRPVRLSYHQQVLNIDADAVAPLSPVDVPPGKCGALLCAVGEEETDEFLRQQREFLAAWGRQGAAVDGMVVPRHHHFSILDCLIDPDDPLFRRVLGLARSGDLGAATLNPDGLGDIPGR